MDRNITQIMEEIGEQVSHFIRNYVIPIIQEFFYTVSRGIDGIVEVLSSKNHSYKAEFITYDEILMKSNRGFCLDGRNCLARSEPNVLVCAPSGAGKSTVISIPSLLKIDGSVICNDPSMEQYHKTAGYLISKGYNVEVLNFAQITNTFYNPISQIHNTADAQKIAGMLVRNVLQNPGDPFWNLSATNLIALSIRILLRHEKQYRNFANVRHLIQLLTFEPKSVDALVAQTNAQDIIADYKSFIAQDTKLRTSIIATAMSALQIFADPIVAKVTSKDTLDLESIRKRKTVIFIHSSTSDMKYYSTLISIFFEQTTKVIMSKLPEKEDNYVFFILDELSSMYLPSLEIVIANIRKYKGSLLCILQSFQQLINIYGREQANAIRMNCFAKVYMAGLDHTTASELSQQLGKYEWIDEETGKKHIRELATPDEVRMLPRDKAILICGNYNPMKLTLTPYYNNPFLKLRTEIPIPYTNTAIDETPVELITNDE
ncbi:MAG: type IV secretory system conjugative DNA transfer family protein [Chitinophagales bacterium]